MIDPVAGYHVGQRVRADGCGEGKIERVVVPTKGRRFLVMHDRQGRAHHCWFDEVHLIETEARGWKPVAPMHKGVDTGFNV